MPKRAVLRLAALLAAWAVLSLAGAQALAQGARGVSPELRLVADALVDRAFPGGRLDWARGTITHGDATGPNAGRSERLSLQGFQWRPESGQAFVIASPELTERLDRISRSLDDPEAPPLSRLGGPLPCRVSAMRITEAGEVTGYREAIAEVPGAASSCVGFDFGVQAHTTEDQSGKPWPLVLVSMISLHRGPDWSARINWAALLNTETMNWRMRIPVAITRRTASGEFFDYLSADRVGDAMLQVRGKSSKLELDLACPQARCLVPPAAVLEAATLLGGVARR